MKKKTKILLTAGVIFVSGNMYLALKDDSKAVRSSYINKWSPVGKDNLTETLHASGVVTPQEEHQVYYSDDDGEFKGFLVKEGDKVDNGTPLYEYSSDNIDEDLAKLESEKSQLVTEKNLIDDQIQQLNYLQTVSASTSNTSTPVFGDGTTGSSNDSNDVMNASIEKEIYDKQREKSRVEAEIDKYEDLIDAYDGSDELGKNSEVSGTVKTVNYELKNPIVTIISDTPKVEGTFTERDLKKVEEGMEVYVKSDLIKGKAAGTLSKIANYPETDPSVKKESRFPFEIELNKETENIIKGTHVDVSVVTKKVLNAATVPEYSVEKGKKNSYVYVLNKAGEVEKRKIKKGMNLNGKVEVKKGANPGELVVQRPEKVQQEESTFFSKLKPSVLKKKTFSEEGKRTIFKHIMVAFFK